MVRFHGVRTSRVSYTVLLLAAAWLTGCRCSYEYSTRGGLFEGPKTEKEKGSSEAIEAWLKKTIEFDHMDPTCGSKDGGTLVRVEGRVDHGSIVGCSIGTIKSSSGSKITFETDKAPDGASLPLTVPVEFTWEATYECKRFLRRKSTKTAQETFLVGEFTYVDASVPKITDESTAIGWESTSHDLVNTDPFDGDACGGDRVTIAGKNFAQDPITGESPVVFFGGVWRLGDAVEFIDSQTLMVEVPPGTPNTWVLVRVVNYPWECYLVSNWGEFYYNDEECEVEEGEGYRLSNGLAEPGKQFVAAGEVFHDGAAYADVVAACEDLDSPTGTGTLVALEGAGDGTFTGERDSLSFEFGRPSSVVLGDFDGNTFLDAAVALNSAGETSRVHVFLNDGADPKSPYYGSNRLELQLGGDLTDLAVADLDGDGNDDLVVVSRETSEVFCILQTAPGELDESAFDIVSLGEAPLRVAVGEFYSGAGGDDLVVLSEEGTLYLLGNEMSYMTELQQVVIPGSPIDVAVGQWTSDSTDEVAVLFSDPGGSHVHSYLNYGDPVYLQQSLAKSIDSARTDPVAIVVGEFNGAYDDLAIGYEAGVIEVVLEPGQPLSTVLDPIALSSALADLAIGTMTAGHTVHDLVVGAGEGEMQVTIVINPGTGF